MIYPDYPPRALAAEKFDDRHKSRALTLISLVEPSTVMPPHFEDCPIPINSLDIERCIAKIALCEAIRSIDASIRDPKIADFILSGEGDASEFLGARLGGEITDNMHSVSHQRLFDGQNKQSALLTTVKLFSWLPTPSYQVVIRPVSSFGLRKGGDN
ncbi:hypothetical protein [Cereibacter sphaeroides]|uniref:hypothetical protein n=1 Tax=Cereibacter sphaeroides TaxID=1063 RepID=UPI001131A964|nr:hypothetical protein [Cereibacter sphaeroides]